jgi:hypothetical protein
MKNYRTTNCNPDEEEKMALDWIYVKETHWIDGGAQRCGCPKKTCKRIVKEEDMESG